MKRPISEVKAEFFKTLSHPARIRILELLREKKILTEDQIAKVLDPAAMTGQGSLSA